MAHLPGRPAERRLRTPCSVLLVLALARPGVVLPATAQEAPEEGPPRAGALVELGGGLTTLDGGAAWVIDGAALIALTPRLAIGGAGTVFPSDRDVEGDLVFPDRALGFGYGGLVVEMALPFQDRSIALSALVGAGNADLRDRRTGTRIASDNVVVFEPEIILRRPATSRLHLGLSLAWRAVRGLDDIEGLASGDLAALTLGAHFRFGPF